MKKLRMFLINSASVVWLLFGQHVFAADTGNAVQDILLSDRFNGAMSSIEWLTNIVDVWFIRIITVTAFFIISSSIFKNVAAGAVCAFPTFWRKVHEAHEKHMLQNMMGKMANIGKAFSKGGGGLNALGGGGQNGGGGIGDFFLSLIPDFMAITEFADNDISPKQYFMKAIPEMIAACCIGIFIYNGLYRDTLATVGTAGANIVSNVLGAADPDRVTHFIFNNIKEPNNSFRDDTSVQGQQIYKISQEMYRKINGVSTTYSASEEGKQGLMGYCETWAANLVKSNTNVFFSNDAYYYDMSGLTVQLLTVQASEVLPTSETLYFSRTVSLSDVINDPNINGDPGFYANGQLMYIQVACNFSIAAREGKTIETQVQAIEGSLAAGSNALPHTAVSIPVDSTWVTSNSGGNGTVIDFATYGGTIKDAIWKAATEGYDTNKGEYNKATDGNYMVQQYGSLGAEQCKPCPITKGSTATVIVTIPYSYTSKDANDTSKTGPTITNTCRVTVTFTYN